MERLSLEGERLAVKTRARLSMDRTIRRPKQRRRRGGG